MRAASLAFVSAETRISSSVSLKMLTRVKIIAIPRFSSAAVVNVERICGYWSLGIVLRGEDGDNDNDSSGIASGYVAGRVTCRMNCANVRQDI